MNVLVILVFVTLMLVLAAIYALAFSVKQADHEHADRLSLLPLDEETPRPDSPSPRIANPGADRNASPEDGASNHIESRRSR